MQAILLGSGVPAFMYLTWNAMILGTSSPTHPPTHPAALPYPTATHSNRLLLLYLSIYLACIYIASQPPTHPPAFPLLLGNVPFDSMGEHGLDLYSLMGGTGSAFGLTLRVFRYVSSPPTHPPTHLPI